MGGWVEDCLLTACATKSRSMGAGFTSPAPHPPPQDAIIRVTATGLCGSDLHLVRSRPEALPARKCWHSLARRACMPVLVFVTRAPPNLCCTCACST